MSEPDPDERPSRSAEAALGERPAHDSLALEVARTRIANALFDTDERVRVGRFQLLDRAGQGGMGVVWSAWDPELERRVAIKLMHVKSETARHYMLREGQALAQLSHPNIVPIYDVGTVGEQVYLVMEWIAGTTLRVHVREPREPREIVDIYRAAGAGVAAAHAAGIVQRDFKPDNVMIGTDGRVRLLDFGLARPASSDGSIAGTPKYMAPEQATGAPPTAAADQYSFGIALAESLGERVPSHVAPVIARATAVDPAARYPDMTALLAALARDPVRVRRRRLVALGLAVGALGAVGTAFAVGRRQSAVAACSGGDEALAEVWTPARADALVRHVGSLGPYGAARAAALADQLAAYGTAWITARRGACLAQQRDEVTTALYERGLACLERARAALDGVATSLSHTTADKLADAIVAARDLPDPARCLADATIDPVAPPPPHLAARVGRTGADATRARYLALADDPSALAAARAAARDADAIAYLPLVAHAQLALGAALDADTSTQSADAYQRAADAALAAGDDATFVEAFARSLYAASKRRDPRTAELAGALPVVAKLGARTGDAGRFGRALLFNNAGSERLAAGDAKSALDWFRKARTVPAPPHVELVAVLGNLAMLVPDRSERDALFAEEQQALEQRLGADHPFTLQVRLRAAMFVEHPREAAARLGDICATYLRLHPDRGDKIASCHSELGWLAVERGDAAEARRAYAIVAAQRSHDQVHATLARAELARLDGDRDAAIALAEPVARTEGAAATWWSHLYAAEAWLVVAAALDDGARRTAALRAARELADDALAHNRATAVARRHARIAMLLALATADRALADRAIAWYRNAGGYDAAIAALNRW